VPISDSFALLCLLACMSLGLGPEMPEMCFLPLLAKPLLPQKLALSANKHGLLNPNWLSTLKK
jgi:hypothetical protein